MPFIAPVDLSKTILSFAPAQFPRELRPSRKAA
jgi:hypothetical protein